MDSKSSLDMTQTKDWNDKVEEDGFQVKLGHDGRRTSDLYDGKKRKI